MSSCLVMTVYMMTCDCLQPKVVTSTDEVELAKELEMLDQMNQEKGGDSSEDSYSDGEADDASDGDDAQ